MSWCVALVQRCSEFDQVIMTSAVTHSHCVCVEKKKKEKKLGNWQIYANCQCCLSGFLTTSAVNNPYKGKPFDSITCTGCNHSNSNISGIKSTAGLCPNDFKAEKKKTAHSQTPFQ